MLKRLNGTYDYIFPLDPAVDLEAWGDKVKDYFVTSFDRPPIKKGEKPTIWTIEPLTGKQMRWINDKMNESDEESIDKALNDGEFIDFVLGHGLRDVTNFDSDGFKVLTEPSKFGGEKLTQETLDEIVPFQRSLARVLVSEILQLSRLQYS